MPHPEVERNQLLRLFADILDYPTTALAEKARQCEEMASHTVPGSAPLVRAFRVFVEETPLGRLEEVYTGFFDLNPVCHPYVGYQLFGESYKRSSFLLGLKDLYRTERFQFSDSELPDRLSVMLRFVAHGRGGQHAKEIVTEGLLPALERITRSNGKTPSASPAELADDGMQLEGHSQGEVLTGGFVLALTEEKGGANPLEINQHPYHQTLLALRMVLEQLYPTQPQEQDSGSPGGKNHVR